MWQSPGCRCASGAAAYLAVTAFSVEMYVADSDIVGLTDRITSVLLSTDWSVWLWSTGLVSAAVVNQAGQCCCRQPGWSVWLGSTGLVSVAGVNWADHWCHSNTLAVFTGDTTVTCLSGYVLDGGSSFWVVSSFSA